MVGLATYAVYSLDNLLDWPSEKHSVSVIQPRWNVYLIWCIFTIPLSLIGILLLAVPSGFSFLLLLGTLAIISLAHTVLTSRDNSPSVVAIWAENLVASLTWALVTVLIPVRYAGQQIVAQTVMAIAFVWHLSWVGTMLWDVTGELRATHKDQLLSLPTSLGEIHLIKLLQIVSISACVLAIVDIVLVFFPWYNISVIAAPIANVILLSLWEQLRRTPLLFINLLFLVDAFCALLVILVYVVAEQGALTMGL